MSLTHVVSSCEKSLNSNQFLFSALSVVQSGRGEGGFSNQSVFLFSNLRVETGVRRLLCLNSARFQSGLVLFAVVDCS